MNNSLILSTMYEYYKVIYEMLTFKLALPLSLPHQFTYTQTKCISSNSNTMYTLDFRWKNVYTLFQFCSLNYITFNKLGWNIKQNISSENGFTESLSHLRQSLELRFYSDTAFEMKCCIKFIVTNVELDWHKNFLFSVFQCTFASILIVIYRLFCRFCWSK